MRSAARWAVSRQRRYSSAVRGRRERPFDLGRDRGQRRTQLVRGVGGESALVLDGLVEPIERLVQRQRDLFELVFRPLDRDARREIPAVIAAAAWLMRATGASARPARNHPPRSDTTSAVRPPAAAVPANARTSRCVSARSRPTSTSAPFAPAVVSSRRPCRVAMPGAGGAVSRNVAGRSIDELALAVPDGVVRRRRGSDAVHLSIFAGKDEVEIAGRRRAAAPARVRRRWPAGPGRCRPRASARTGSRRWRRTSR